jgi:hypothetical protein
MMNTAAMKTAMKSGLVGSMLMFAVFLMAGGWALFRRD